METILPGVWSLILIVVFFGELDGALRSSSPKRYYTVVDGLIGMQGSGPMQGDHILLALFLWVLILLS